jgi:hypothetical protein
MQCSHIKSNGQRCKNKSKNPLCHIHKSNEKKDNDKIEQKEENITTFDVQLNSSYKLLEKLNIDKTLVDKIEIKIYTKNKIQKLYNEVSLDSVESEVNTLKRNIEDLNKQLEKTKKEYQELKKNNGFNKVKHCHHMDTEGNRCRGRHTDFFCVYHIKEVFEVYTEFLKFRKLVDEKKEGCPIPKCDNYKNKVYCKQHEEKFKFEKPDDCPICCEDMTRCKFPLKCGHWAHTECVTRWQDKCPICRKKYVLWDEHNTRSKRNNERELAKYGRLLEQITTEEAFATMISC